MVLEYKFKYFSKSNSFISILDNFLNEKGILFKIDRNEEFIFLYVEDEEERLLKISDELSAILPMSIFLEDFTLEVVSQIPDTDFRYKKNICKKSYCSNCLAKIEDDMSDHFSNPFFNCSICGTTCDVNSLKIYENEKPLEYKTFKELFSTLASKIADGKKVKINDFTFSKLEKLENEKQTLLCTNIESLSSLVVGSKQKSVALLSLEKPSIDFNVNTIYQSHNNCDIKKVNVCASWDLFLYLLSKELLAYNINFLTYEKSDSSDLSIEYPSDYSRVKISITQNKIHLLENQDYDERLTDLYNKFDEKAKSQFMVLSDENDLYEKSVLNIYNSSKYDDAVTLYSPKIDGMIDVLTLNLPNNINDIFSEIIKEESGAKLIENYKNKFPELFLNALNFDLSKLENNSITSLWKIASVVLGIDDIYEKASSALLQKGPRIDYKLKESEKIFNKEFELEKFIKSGISFKLAGVDEKTLSLGYIESYSYFLSDLIDEVNASFELDGISLCGDLFAEEFFTKQIDKSFNKTIKLYYNKDFPIQL